MDGGRAGVTASQHDVRVCWGASRDAERPAASAAAAATHSAAPYVTAPTGLSPAPQRTPPANELCHYTPHGLLRTYGPALCVSALRDGSQWTSVWRGSPQARRAHLLGSCARRRAAAWRGGCVRQADARR